MSSGDLTDLIRRELERSGFDAIGVAPVTLGLGGNRLDRWLEQGRHGEMNWMENHSNVRKDPNGVLKDACSVVVVALSYLTVSPRPIESGEARISRYAWGNDYHEEIRARLFRARKAINEQFADVRLRPFVDSAPVMERDYAQLAGLGWFGKNTLLLNKKLGSWFFLGGLLVDRELHYDVPFGTEHCGSCTACLEACPTEAFLGPYELDPRRCLSYLTIEHRSEVAEDLAERFDEWIYGCDVCQDVCPWNHRVSPKDSMEFLPRAGTNPLAIEEILKLDDDSFSLRFRGTAIHRSGRTKLVRNALLVAGNQRLTELRQLVEVLCRDADEIVRHTANMTLRKFDELSSLDQRPKQE